MTKTSPAAANAMTPAADPARPATPDEWRRAAARARFLGRSSGMMPAVRPPAPVAATGTDGSR